MGEYAERVRHAGFFIALLSTIVLGAVNDAREKAQVKKKNEIYSEENGFTRIPKVQRANFINFDQVEATQGEITPAASFERMPSPERIKASFEEYERWILLEMLPRKDSRKARFMLVSREPEIAGRYSKVFEIDLGAIRLREHKKIILFDPFGGFGMD